VPYSSAEGEAATNSQAKGPNSDETLESLMTPKKQSFNLALIIINYYKLALKENLSGTITEANCLRNSSLFYVYESIVFQKFEKLMKSIVIKDK
jgi:hypothetical protein